MLIYCKLVMKGAHDRIESAWWCQLVWYASRWLHASREMGSTCLFTHLMHLSWPQAPAPSSLAASPRPDSPVQASAMDSLSASSPSFCASSSPRPHPVLHCFSPACQNPRPYWRHPVSPLSPSGPRSHRHLSILLQVSAAACSAHRGMTGHFSTFHQLPLRAASFVLAGRRRIAVLRWMERLFACV